MKITNCITLVLVFLVGCNSEGSHSESEVTPTLIGITIVYWSKTPNSMQYDALGLSDGMTSTFPVGTTVYATCVSEP